MACINEVRAFAAAALLVASTAAAAAMDSDRATYLVALSDPPLAAHVAARVHTPGMSAQDEKRAARSALASVESGDYLRQLEAARANVLGLASQRFGRTLAPRQVYRHGANGMALVLSADEAQRIAGLPGVAGVRRERILRLHTDAGPQWIGADALWGGAVGGVAATKGEGVVIGVIDTGINVAHPSFAATGGDGYTAVNPRGHFYGLCVGSPGKCNAKLIGVYDFTSENTFGADSVGHGSHTAGIAAGNVLADSLQGYTVSLARNVSGVAPHANLIAYKACQAQPIDPSSDGTCAESALVGAIDQAIADQVDVINYSIGGPSLDPYALLADTTSDAYAFFNARSSGIVIAVSAGNEGPGPYSVDEPGNVPWVIAAANASHNRRFVNSLGAFSGGANAPATLQGQGYTSGYGPAAIVYAADYGNALCGTGESQGVTPDGASNPFPPGTFHGEIVICDRGTYARVEKGYNVKAAGAGGYILANAPADGESINSDNHYLPAVHLGYSEGHALEAWVASAGTHSGTISGVSATLAGGFGDILDASSSRGPYGFGGGVLKPDITAPGDNILSAAQTGGGLALLSGTSMASPHVAGAAALVLAVHPDWSPAQVESTLTGTALAGVRRQDGVIAASPLDAGGGRVQPAAAVQAGLYLPLTTADFFAGSGTIANPLAHGDLSKLNRTGIESENCFQHCSFTRTVKDLSGGGTWQVASTATPGAAITVTPSQFTLAAGGAQALAITIDVSDPHLPGTWVDGRIVLHKTGGGRSATDIALSAAVYASAGIAPEFQSITANAPGGSATIALSGLVGLPQATFTATSLAPAVTSDLALAVDTNSADLYGTFPAPGRQFVLFPNVYQQGVDAASYGRLFIVEIAASNAPQADLYAGIDSNGNGQPDADEQVCSSSTVSGLPIVARCVVDLRGAGPVNVWALVDIPQGGAGASYAVTLSSGIPTFNIVLPAGLVAQQLHVVGPGRVAAAASFPLRVFWGPDGTDPSALPLAVGTYYGAIAIDGVGGLAPNALGQSGIVPLALTRIGGGDDQADALEPGEFRYFQFSGPATLRHLFVDVPGGATTLEVDTSLIAGASNPVAFSAVRADFPLPAASPDIAPAPAGPAATTWRLDSVTPSRRTLIPVTPGRWYITAQYDGSIARSISMASYLSYGAAAAPTLAPGNYFNPQRSGHGIFLSEAAGQRVVDWYTFLEDGTPAWYLAQGPVPAAAAGTWTATLYRVTWDGGSSAPTPVGDVTLTATSADYAMFSWHLFGTTGSEAFELIATPACVAANGGSVNLNGEWFAPAQAGYGFDALVIPSQQFDAFYLYDDTGNPRWVVGAQAPFADPGSIAMLQSTGFCPTCAYRALTTQPAGSMSVQYSSGSAGQLTTGISLNAPLSGTWSVSQPIARLTGSAACTP